MRHKTKFKQEGGRKVAKAGGPYETIRYSSHDIPNLSRNRLAEVQTQEVIESKQSFAVINLLVLYSTLRFVILSYMVY